MTHFNVLSSEEIPKLAPPGVILLAPHWKQVWTFLQPDN